MTSRAEQNQLQDNNLVQRNCLRALYNKIRPAALKDEDADCLHGIAFAELVVFMEDMHADEDNAPVFYMWQMLCRRE